MRQETLTVVARVSDVPELLAGLATLSADRLGSGSRYFQPRAFASRELGIHFARLVFLPGDAGRGDDWLVFESNFDTAEADASSARNRHLTLLAEREYLGLSAVFRHCEGFPVQTEPARLAGFFNERSATATASYQGHTERDLARIRLERAVRDALMAFLERAPRAGRNELFAQLRDHLRLRSQTDPELFGLNIDEPPPALPSPSLRSQGLRDRIGPWLWNAAPALPLVPQIPRVIHWGESDSAFDLRARQEAWTDEDKRRFANIAKTEDHGVQNALTHLVPLRSGEQRESVLRTAHAYIDRMAKAYFNDIGQLGGIPSIHFAKWLLVDQGRRLLFLSNYDSSWESYLGDFVDQAAVGLNLAWSCTEGYPRTHLLALGRGFRDLAESRPPGGAEDEERFKSWGRAHQLPTQVFYSAYPDLSIAAINNNSLIRHGLHERPSSTELGAWFRRLT
jgi:hypothetical protein